MELHALTLSTRSYALLLQAISTFGRWRIRVGLHDFESVCHSSHLQDIIPAGLEEEGVGVDVEGGGVGMSTLALDSVMGYGGEEEEEEGEVGSEKSSEDGTRKE